MISVAQSISNSRNDLQNVMAVTHALLASFVSKSMVQKQLVVWLFPGSFEMKYLWRSDEDEAMGQQERPTTSLRKFTSCGLNLRFLRPAVVYSV